MEYAARGRTLSTAIGMEADIFGHSCVDPFITVEYRHDEARDVNVTWPSIFIEIDA